MNSNRNMTGAAIGIILVVIGALALFGNFIGSLNMDNFWPLIVVGVGLVFFLAVALGGKSQAGLAVPGAILVTVGLILLVMNYTDTWEAWSYCWALVVAASGAGTWIIGVRTEQPELRRRGLATVRSGLVLFVVFAVIMEFIFTLTGEHRQVNTLLWALLLCGLGLVLLVAGLFRLGKPEGEKVDLFWPILMMGVGAAAILFQLNWIPEANLWRMLNLWPLLLIVAGVGILLRNRSPWVGALLGLLVVGGIFLVGLTGGGLGLPDQAGWVLDLGSIQIGDRELVTGSGNRVSEQRPVSGVSRVELAIPADLEIQQGSTEGLTVTADDNLLPLLRTDVSGGKLIIQYEHSVEARPSQRPHITLTVKGLERLQVSSSGDVKVNALTTGDFDLALSSSGNIDMQGLQAERITARLTSSGDILLAGEADELNLDVSSSGSFDAGDLKVRAAEVDLTSSGEVTLWVVDDLRANISSSGNIYYYGNPSVHENLSSSGNLISRGDK